MDVAFGGLDYAKEMFCSQEKSRALMNLQDERVTVDEELSWLLVQHEQNIADLKEQERQLDKDIAEVSVIGLNCIWYHLATVLFYAVWHESR